MSDGGTVLLDLVKDLRTEAMQWRKGDPVSFVGILCGKPPWTSNTIKLSDVRAWRPIKLDGQA